MDHASEYSHKLVSAEEEAVRGAVWHHASFPPYFDEFPGQEEEDEMHLMVFPGLVPAATCGLNREHLFYDNSAGDRKPHDPGALKVQARPDGALAGALRGWRLSWPT